MVNERLQLCSVNSKMGVCAECSRSCLALHGAKLDPKIPNPIVSSFFKVMFGNHFSEMLMVPPRFTKNVMALKGKTTYLEVSTGQKWTVDLCDVNGSLAFQKGWHKFSVDHGIELGDFLVFHYIKGSHFVVKIFGRTGCEKPIIFNGRNYQNTRATLSRDSIPSYEESPVKARLDSCLGVGSPDVDYNQREDDLQNVKNSQEMLNGPREKNRYKRPYEESPVKAGLDSCLGSGSPDVDYNQREDDLQNVKNSQEMLNVPREKNRYKRPYEESSVEARLDSCLDSGSPDVDANRSENDLQNVKKSQEMLNVPREKNRYKRPNLAPFTDSLVESYFMTNRDTSLTREDDRHALFDLSVFEMPELKEDANKRISVISNEADWSRNELVPPPDNTLSRVDMPLNVILPSGRLKIDKQTSKSDENVCVKAVANNLLCNSAMLSSTNCNHKLRNRTLGWHSGESTTMEEDMIVNVSSASGFKITCSIQQDSEYYLELPKPLPKSVCKQGQRSEKNLVLLQDPDGRLWPVIYHRRDVVKVLANGWKEFRKSNSIQSGDECTFVFENINRGVFQVQIFRSCL